MNNQEILKMNRRSFGIPLPRAHKLVFVVIWGTLYGDGTGGFLIHGNNRLFSVCMENDHVMDIYRWTLTDGGILAFRTKNHPGWRTINLGRLFPHELKVLLEARQREYERNRHQIFAWQNEKLPERVAFSSSKMET